MAIKSATQISIDDLAKLIVFVQVPTVELTWLVVHSTEQHLAVGEYFCREGDPLEYFYVVLEGELTISQRMAHEETVLGTTPAGIMGGELAFLSNALVANLSARAIMPTRLLLFNQPAFREIFAACPIFGARILQTAAERSQGRASILKQQEKMAALGKLAAGLAHELNNPAAAIQRAAKTLDATLRTLQTHALHLHKCDLRQEQLDQLAIFQQTITTQAKAPSTLSPLEISDCEETLGSWLDQLGINNAWTIAPTLVAAQVTVAQLQSVVEQIPAADVGDVLAWLHEGLSAGNMLSEIEESGRRISQLVASIKEYTYMDQGQVQEVDIQHGLENTLKILDHKLRGVAVTREYDRNLPHIWGRGGELNQVWTNLIDNAVDALHEKMNDDEAHLHVITRCEQAFVMVEVHDNGPGIPPEIQPRIFDPFFTTKDVGKGTGLGLDISYRIIRQHHGTIELQSRPGNTRFIVRLPINAG
ncbi:ATP-binding protein [soil metagenome]